MAQIQDDPVVTDDPSRRGDAPDKLGSSHEAMLEGGKWTTMSGSKEYWSNSYRSEISDQTGEDAVNKGPEWRMVLVVDSWGFSANRW